MGETHRIADDLDDALIEELAEVDIAALEALLDKHARFRAFLEENGRL